jgi:uncharacterized protein (TIGR00369 family)
VNRPHAPKRLKLPLEFPLERPPVDEGYHRYLGYRMLDWREDTCTLELTIGDAHVNTQGMAHGGIISGILDVALSFSCVMHRDGHYPGAVTIALNVNYIAAAFRGDVLTITANVQGGGRRTKATTAEVRHADGRLIAIGSAAIKVPKPD